MTEAVVVAVVQGEGEEMQIRAFLAANEIPTITRGEALRKTHGLTLDGLGAVEILVAAENADDARDLLDQVERGELALDPSAEI